MTERPEEPLYETGARETGAREEACPPREWGVLEALQVYRAAETAMRRRTGAAMGIGENDLLALRLILDNAAEGRRTSAKDVSAYVGVSSASTTALIDRLVRAAFIERRTNETDRRSLDLVPTRAALGETGPLNRAQEQLAAEAAGLSEEEARTVTRFLTRMRATVDRIGGGNDTRIGPKASDVKGIVR